MICKFIKKEGNFMNKKIISVLIALAMIACVVLPVYADSTTATLTVSPSYELTIPATLTMSQTEDVSMTISVSGINLADSTALYVTVSGDTYTGGDVTFYKDGDSTSAYYATSTLTTSDAEAVNGVPYSNGMVSNIVYKYTPSANSSASDEGEAEITLSAAVVGDEDMGLRAGTYTAVLTFTAAIYQVDAYGSPYNG